MKILQSQFPCEWDHLNLYGLGDLHTGDRLSDLKMFKAHIDTIVADPYGAAIINGDICNVATRHSVSDIYSEICSPNEAIDITCDLLSPIKDKIVAITEGNHEYRAYRESGILIMYQVATRFNIFEKYSEGAYLLYISIGSYRGRDGRNMKTGRGKTDGRQYTYSIYGKHGAGGGRKKGAKAIRLQDMAATIDADVFIHSHTHEPMSFRSRFMRCDYRNRKITEIDQLFVNTNAWLKYGGYAEEKGYSPASTEPPMIILYGDRKLAKATI